MSTLLTMSNEFSWAIASLSSNLSIPAACSVPLQIAVPALSVSHVRPKPKQPEEVFRGRGGNFFASTPSVSARVSAVRATQAGSLRLPRLGAGASQGASVSTRTRPAAAGRHVAQRLGLGIGQIPGKRDQKAQVQRAPRLLPAAAEAVHHAAQAGCPPMLFQNLEKIVPGVGRTRLFGRQWIRMGRLRAAAISSCRISPSRCTSRAARPRGSSPGRSRRRRSPPARPAGRRAWPERRRRSPACCADRRRRWRRAAAA